MEQIVCGDVGIHNESVNSAARISTYTVGKFIIAPTGVDPVPVSFSLTSVIEIPKGAPEVLWILTVGGPDIGSGSKIKLLVQYRGDRVSRFQPAGIRKYVEDLK